MMVRSPRIGCDTGGAAITDLNAGVSVNAQGNLIIDIGAAEAA